MPKNKPTKVLSENANLVATDRYFMENENWNDLSLRVGSLSASVESNKSHFAELFSEIIFNQLFLPAGRILRNAGRPKGSLFNCYVLPIGDSIEEIATSYKESLILWSEGGGIGCNFSSLRPKGAKILGKGGTSSGLVSFIQASNDISMVVESGGSRRAAAMGVCSIYHPEVLDFIDAKIEHGKISQYNISVGIDNKFIEAVESDKEWTFRFKQQDYGSMPARKIWDKIVKNMLECAEPGLLNMSNLTKNNSYYFAPISATNPCGEVPLEAYGVCCLGSLVLPNFITGNVNTNWKKLEETIKIAVRFLDNIIDCNNFVLRENDIAAHNSRRIGLGVLGLSEYFFAKGIRYGSDKSIQEAERLMKFIRDVSYETSVELAMEKGSFPKFDPVHYGKASFVRKLPASLRMSIKKNGIRNVTLNAVAPTGCLVPETKIKTTKGEKSLEDIFKENDINVRDEKNSVNKWIEPKKDIYVKTLEDDKKITKLYINGKKEVIRVVLKNGTVIEGTPNHKILIIDRFNPVNSMWCRLDELNPQDVILIKK